MLTVDYDVLGLREGDLLLDLGCGFGRHAYEGLRRRAKVVACDMAAAELKEVRDMFAAMQMTGEALDGPEALAACVNGDATRLPFGDATFDRIIASEVLEHIPDDQAALDELARVLRPGCTLAVTVPAWLAESVCWALNDSYYAPKAEGGHLRIYVEAQVRNKLEAAGLEPGASHHAHALHAPYWWLKCAVGIHNDSHPLVRAYHSVLLWDISKAPWPTRLFERVANPFIGKSLVVYATKPLAAEAAA